MLSLRILSALLLPLAALAAKPSGDRFADFHTKPQPLKLDDTKYTSLTTAPRDYSSIVLLTAMDPRIGCVACQAFAPEWDLLARSWQKGDKQGKGRVVFGTLDFADGKATFQSLMLQHAPVLLLFRPTKGPDAVPDPSPVRLDFATGSQSAESIHAWLSRHLPEGPRPRVVRPVNYMRIGMITLLALGTVSAISVAGPYILPLIQNRNLWAALSLIAVLMFTSGHMFNHIRKTPYVSGDGRGGISYFAGGFQNQFGLETQIVAAIYGVLAFSAITLATKVPRIADERIQGFAVFTWAGIMYLMYSFLLSVFRFKNGGYPFHLPPF
ncbi:hypothetical protein EJ06DRAFT_474031 [Trichodelitschia bisporula]|uniref:Oligosaccharyl transferas-like protein subunit n=1 Tax=Trichodelitschia bisporula TaxID=703511 RepID=A0A6G1I3M7_9PEZI|nr:hypothetical protein EJ06DRAFT_474031 [Trichodelitschia bisporula]